MRTARAFYPVFFVSGAAGLIYQVVWVRALADALGSTAVSMTAVFSVFLTGLALGAWAFGRLDPSGRPALTRYIRMEVAIAFTAVVASLLLFTQSGWIAAAAPDPDRLGATVGYALVVSALVMGVPALLMGGTLPTLLGALATVMPARPAALRLYGWNTVGAAVGALAAGFFLIWFLGLRATVLTGALLDLLSAGGALYLRGRIPFPDTASAGSPREEPEVVEASAPSGMDRGGAAGKVEWALIAFASGALILGLEILWGRISRFLLGDRTQAVAALLFVFIAALGVAALVAPPLARAVRADTRAAGRALMGVFFLLGGALQLAVLPVVVGSVAPEVGPLLDAVRASVGGRLLLATLLIAPPIFVLGLVFPVLIWSADRIDSVPARRVGGLYLVNTLGAVVGAVTATFLLSRWTGTILGFQLLSAAAIGLGLLLLIRGRGSVPLRRPVVWLVPLLLLGAVAVTLTPRSLAFTRADERLLFDREDEYGVQVLTETDAGTYRVRNNRLSLVFDLGHPQTTHAQQMAAHLPILLAGDARQVLNIGTGYGITAGTFTLYPEVERVRTVEILPFLIELQEWFGPYNFDLARDPRVELLQGDGRQALLSATGRWDVISVNVLDPYLPGSSPLYTVEFWEEARDRLRPGGVFTQLFWGEDVALLVRGISLVFPEVFYFPAYGGTSFNVVAFRDPLPAGGPSPRFERMSPEARGEWLRVEGAEPEEAFPRLLQEAGLVGERLGRLAAMSHGPLHTVDRPILEYRWSHGTAGVAPFDSPLILY